MVGRKRRKKAVERAVETSTEMLKEALATLRKATETRLEQLEEIKKLSEKLLIDVYAERKNGRFDVVVNGIMILHMIPAEEGNLDAAAKIIANYVKNMIAEYLEKRLKR